MATPARAPKSMIPSIPTLITPDRSANTSPTETRISGPPHRKLACSQEMIWSADMLESLLIFFSRFVHSLQALTLAVPDRDHEDNTQRFDNNRHRCSDARRNRHRRAARLHSREAQ